MKRIFCLSAAGLLLITFTVAAVAPQINRLVMEKEIATLQKQLREKERNFLEPSAQDKAPYTLFLAQPDTGIFRLLSRDGSEEKLLTVYGNGAYYSFARMTNEYGRGNDISLNTGRIQMSNGNNSLGLISLLGDIPLETVTIDHPAVEFLKTAMTGKDSPGRQIQRQSQNGFRQGEFTYTKEAVASSNTTYVLRSVDPPGSDLLIAMRVVKRDVDGSVVIVWKKLKTFPAPVIER